MIAHIVYLSSQMPICENPHFMGNDFVVARSLDNSTPACRKCSDLLRDFNERAYLEELQIESYASRMKRNVAYIEPPTITYLDGPDEGNAIHAMLLGMFLGSIFWIVFYILLERLVFS